MTELLPFFIILFAAVFFSELFKRLHLPWVVALILAGLAVGPSGLGAVEPNDVTLEFLGQIGLIFLMFMAGLETKVSGFLENRKGILTLVLFNGGLPFIAGVAVGLFFGLEFSAALLMGIIFTASSVAVIIPSLQSSNFLQTKLGKTIVAATVLEDTLSLVLLSVLLQNVSPIASLPLPAFYVVLFIALFVMRWLITKVRAFFAIGVRKKGTLMQQELTSIFALLIGTVVAFELLGLHPIIAGFFAGLVMSDHVTSDILKEKLMAISYGLFVPIFFILVGSRIDLSIFAGSKDTVVFVAVVVLAAISSKFIGGMLGGRLSGFEWSQGALIGVASIPSLSTTLAVVFTGFELGILDQRFTTALIILSVVTTFLSPVLVELLSKMRGQEPVLVRQIGRKKGLLKALKSDG